MTITLLCPRCGCGNDEFSSECSQCHHQLPLFSTMGGNGIEEDGTIDTSVVSVSEGLEGSPGARFEIIDVLGRGGMGVVYRAFDKLLEREVALKVLPAELVDSGLCLREARLASSLSHPNLATIFDFQRVGSNQFIIMEIAPGETLAKWKRKSPDQRAVLAIAIRIAAGLEAAHNAGIVHRDIKPGNIMVSPEGRVTVLDFGLAVISGMNSRGDGLQGTVMYMSPEQAMNQPLDARSDIFSLGIVLYELLSGQHPFSGRQAFEVFDHICRRKLDPIPGVHSKFCEVIERMLAKMPEERYSNGGSLLRALEAVDASMCEQVRSPFRIGRILVLASLLLSLLLAFNPVDFIGAWRADPSIDAHGLVLQGKKMLRAYYLEQNRTGAIEVLQRAVTMDPQSAAARAYLGRALLWSYESDGDSNKLKTAEEHILQGLELSPKLAAAWLAQGILSRSKGSYNDAISHLETACRIDPLETDALVELGITYEKLRDWDSADQCYRKALAIAPEAWYPNFQLGVLNYRLGRFVGAEQFLVRAVASAPDNFLSYRTLGAVYYLMGKPEQALNQYQKALEIKKSSSVYSNMATLFFYQGRYEEAAETYREALQLSPERYLIWGNLADTYRQILGREAQTIEAYDKAISLVRAKRENEPLDEVLRIHEILYLARMGDVDGASDLLGEGIEIRDVGERFNLAIINELLGRREKALEHLGVACSLGLDRKDIEAEPDFEGLCDDPGFSCQ